MGQKHRKVNGFKVLSVKSEEKHDGQASYDYTMFTVARDPQNVRYYWKTYDDQTIRMVDMKALRLSDPSLAISGSPQVRLLGTATTQPIVDMSSQLVSQK